MTRVRLCVLLLLLLLWPAGAFAQGPVAPLVSEPLPWVVADLRLAFPGLGADALTADALGVLPPDLPSRALTGIVGLHTYPLRRTRWKLGIGAEFLAGRANTRRTDTEGNPIGDPIHRTLESLSWQLSMNFGRGQGWSYLTAGSGPFAFSSFLGDGPGDGPGRTTLNLGAGARWFKWDHVAFTADLRFYLTKAADGTVTTAPRGAQRLVIFSAGLSIK